MKDERHDMNEDKPKELKDRTKQFALRIVRLYAALPKKTVAQVLGRQMLRSGTSVGAHYREGMFGRSDAEFVSKLEGALQELEETSYWLELLVDSGTVSEDGVQDVVRETRELIAILVTCVKRVKNRNSK